MELISSLFVVLAVLLLVIIFVARPFVQGKTSLGSETTSEAQKQEHLRSSLLAERDRLLTALQELDFDYGLGKVPAEEYQAMRAQLLQTGAHVLRQLDDMTSAGTAGAATVEDRIEAAIAARRADARDRRGQTEALPETVALNAAEAAPANAGSGRGNHTDSLEDLIASRKRARSESAAGFCPKCGKPAQKSDKFCSKCGTTL